MGVRWRVQGEGLLGKGCWGRVVGDAGWHTKMSVPRRHDDDRARCSEKKAASYSPALHCSTIGAGGLNFSVRNGKRWDPVRNGKWEMTNEEMTSTDSSQQRPITSPGV